MAPVAVMAKGISVSIEGVDKELKTKLLATVSIARQKETDTLTEARIRQLERRSQKEILQVLQAFGYYRPRIDVKLQRNGQAWQVSYYLTPGIQIKVYKLDIQISGPAQKDPLLADYAQRLPLKEGDHLTHLLYEKTKRGLLELALDSGYLDARLSRHELLIDLDVYQAEVHLHLVSGPAYYFGPIRVQQEVLDPAFVNRFIHVKAGDRYTTGRLLALENDLRDSDHFSRIQVQPHREQTVDFAIPVDVSLTPKPRNKYTFGIGYGTDTGARGSVGWEQRRVNKQGHRMGAELKVAERRDSLTSHYIIPIRDPRTDRITFTASYTHERPETSDSRIGLLGIARSISRSRWQETAFLNYHHESFTIADQADTIQVFYPGMNWEWVKTDNRIFTRRGSRFNFELRGANDALVSDVSFAQGRLKAKRIQPLWASARLIARGTIGETKVGDIRDLPASMRFFAGGDHSVRGYAHNSLGPVDDDGNVIGGRRLLVGSLEFEQRLGGNWSAAAFYDAGNALEDYSDPLMKSAGVGIRWKSPIGQVRVDVASALSKPDRPLRWHIIIGPDL